MWSVSRSKHFIFFLTFLLLSSTCLKPVSARDRVERYEFNEHEMKIFNGALSKVFEGTDLEEIVEVELEVDNSSFMTEFLLADGSTVMAEVNARPGEEVIPVTLIETVNGKEERSEYLADIEEATEELEIKGDVTDISTGETFLFNTNDNQKVNTMRTTVPAGISMTLAAIYALAAIFFIVLESVVYVSVQKAQREKTAEHFVALRGNTDLYIGRKLTAKQAYARAKAGGDTWSVTKAKAKNVAREANLKGNPYSEVNKSNGKPKKGSYYHWHPYQKKPAMHAFYGGPVK